MTIHGIELRPGCALRIKNMCEFDRQDFPVYAQLKEIIVWEDEKFFIVNILDTVAFSHQFMGYQVRHSKEDAVVLFHNLPSHGVYNIVSKRGKKFIIEKSCANVEECF